MLYFSDNAHLGWVRDSATWEDCTKLGGPKRILECVWPEKELCSGIICLSPVVVAAAVGMTGALEYGDCPQNVCPSPPQA